MSADIDQLALTVRNEMEGLCNQMHALGSQLRDLAPPLGGGTAPQYLLAGSAQLTKICEEIIAAYSFSSRYRN